MRAPTPARQNGRHNEEREKRKNRKPNKKTNADIIEDAKEVADAINNIGVRPLVVSSNTVGVGPSNNESNHAKVESDRPGPEPSWFQKQQAFQPSRSYSKKKDET